MAEPPSERRPVGARLRALRQNAGVSQVELAARLGITQGRVSRVEMETVLPSSDLAARYLDALGVREDERQDILDELVEQRIEVATWRRLHRAGLRQHQQRYGTLERSAAAVRDWSDRIVPGLLQTGDYTRAMCRVWDVPGLTDAESIVAGRAERQDILRDRTKRFAFLLAEEAIRTADIPREVMVGQLDAILLAALATHIEVGIVPAGVMAPASTAFRLLDDRSVFVELDTREVVIHEPEEVARYLDIFERLRARSVRGEGLAELIRRLRRTIPELAD